MRGGEYVTAQWCDGTIEDVSSAGSYDTTGSKRRKLGLGWLWIKYDDGSFGWLLANRPSFYKAKKPGGWRFDDDDDDDADDADEDSDGVDDDDLVDADDDDDDDCMSDN